MDKATHLRFEQPHKPNKEYKEYLKNLKANELMQGIHHSQKIAERKDFHDEWVECSNRKLQARALKNERKQLGHELKMVANANLLVRRRALALRIETDQKIYEKELAQIGKAFYKERL